MINEDTLKLVTNDLQYASDDTIFVKYEPVKSRVKRTIQEHKTPELFISKNATYLACLQTIKDVYRDNLPPVNETKLASQGLANSLVEDRIGAFSEPIPKVIELGLHSVLELIKETHTSQPVLCSRALSALFDILQGLHPEQMRHEPKSLIDAIITILIRLASPSATAVASPECLGSPSSTSSSTGRSLSSLAASSWASLVVARGDLSGLLSFVSYVLMSAHHLASEELRLPEVVVNLQLGLHALLTGSDRLDTWFSAEGVTSKCKLVEAPLSPGLFSEDYETVLACDGRFIYAHNSHGLHKVGSGYKGTVLGYVYATNTEFRPQQKLWLGCARGQLFCAEVKSKDERVGDNEVEETEEEEDGHGKEKKRNNDEKGVRRKSESTRLICINTEMLVEEKSLMLQEEITSETSCLVTDGEYICRLAKIEDDKFCFQCFSPGCSPLPLIKEMRWNLSQRVTLAIGHSEFDKADDDNKSTVHCFMKKANMPEAMDKIVQVVAGREFALSLTETGRLFYRGNAEALGLPSTSASSRLLWQPYPHSAGQDRIVGLACGHEGAHAMMWTEQGAAFFCGTVRRGNDGGKPVRFNPGLCPGPAAAVAAAQALCGVGGGGGGGGGGGCGRAVCPKPVQLDNIVADGGTGKNTSVQVAMAACNQGSTLLLTKCGRLVMLGKDEMHLPADHALSKHTVVHVALGKAHGMALTKTGMLFAFGMNNRGQCGIQSAVLSKEDDSEEEGSAGTVSLGGDADSQSAHPPICAPDKHDFAFAWCKLCRQCGECTGLGPECVLHDQRRRAQPGEMCGCGQGSAGCSKCGVCFKCALAPQPTIVVQDEGLEAGQEGSANRQRQASQLIAVGPTRVPLRMPSGANSRIVDVACGLHHTVVLFDSGTVITFGANSHAQLGRGGPSVKEAPGPLTRVDENVSRIAAGSNFTACLTAHTNTVHCFGQGFPDAHLIWHVESGRSVVRMSASGPQLFITLVECLLSETDLKTGHLVANADHVVLFSGSVHVVVERSNGRGSRLGSPGPGNGVCLDPLHNVLWMGRGPNLEGFHPMLGQGDGMEELLVTLKPSLALPIRAGSLVTRSHLALYLLGALDTLVKAQERDLWSLMIRNQHTLIQSPPSTGEVIGATGNAGERKLCRVERFEACNEWEGEFPIGAIAHDVFEANLVFRASQTIHLHALLIFHGCRLPANTTVRLYADSQATSESSALRCEASGRVSRTDIDDRRLTSQLTFPSPVRIEAGEICTLVTTVRGQTLQLSRHCEARVQSANGIVFNFESIPVSGVEAVDLGLVAALLFHPDDWDARHSSSLSSLSSPFHRVSPALISNLTPDCFEALLNTLKWAWTTLTFLLSEMEDLVSGPGRTATKCDLRRLAYVAEACLRLLRFYLLRLYPSPVKESETDFTQEAKPMANESSRFAECVGDIRLVLKNILQDTKVLNALTATAGDDCSLLEECLRLFQRCFYIFQPTPSMKWDYLCEVLARMQLHSGNQFPAAGHGPSLVLAAVLESFVGGGQGRMLDTCPLLDEGGVEEKGMMAKRFPLLVRHMQLRAQIEGSEIRASSAKEVIHILIQLLAIPLKSPITSIDSIEKLLSDRIGHFMLNLMVELEHEATAQPKTQIDVNCLQSGSVGTGRSSRSQTGSEKISGPSLHTTRCRFRVVAKLDHRCAKVCRDRLLFMVAREGVMLAGCKFYKNGHETAVQLTLHEQIGNKFVSEWRPIACVTDNFAKNHTKTVVGHILFTNPIPLKANSHYRLELSLKNPQVGMQTTYGRGSRDHIRGPDGTLFHFFSAGSCDHQEGHVAHFVYKHRDKLVNDVGTNENARRASSKQWIREILSEVFATTLENLRKLKATYTPEELSPILECQPFFKIVSSLIGDSVQRLICTDLKFAYFLLYLVQDLMPCVVSCLSNTVPGYTNEYLAVVESDHPYKQGVITNYCVRFPTHVVMMRLDFDERSGLSQEEDRLYLLQRATSADSSLQPVLAPLFGGVGNCGGGFGRPGNDMSRRALILPGNEVIFSLQTASRYNEEDRGCNTFGFRCLVIGYGPDPELERFSVLERKLAFIGGLCSRQFLQCNIAMATGSNADIALSMATRHTAWQTHRALLHRGLVLSRVFNVSEALTENAAPPLADSSERQFLRDFVDCTPGSLGARLATWLQPTPFVDPNQCETLLSTPSSASSVKCGQTVTITVLLRDQTGRRVVAKSCHMLAQALPDSPEYEEEEEDEDNTGPASSVAAVNGSGIRWSGGEMPGPSTFGGKDPPNVSIPYETTLRDKRDRFHAISMMKAYEDYSFEEVRLATPLTRRFPESLLVQVDEANMIYRVLWTPSSCGQYRIQIRLDDCPLPGSPVITVGGPVTGRRTVMHGGTATGILAGGVVGGGATGGITTFLSPQAFHFPGLHSAGLRIRSEPSLLSPPVGVVRPGGRIRCSQELHNDDGVWVKLSADALEGCGAQNASVGWCLRVNHHTGKTLLTRETPVQPQQGPRTTRTSARPESQINGEWQGGPGRYRVVSCASVGHSIRAQPNLNGTPVGWVTRGEIITAETERTTREGLWLRVDRATLERHCYDQAGQAWCLARTSSGFIFLRREMDTDDIEDESVIEEGMDNLSPVQQLPMSPVSTAESDIVRVGTRIRSSLHSAISRASGRDHLRSKDSSSPSRRHHNSASRNLGSPSSPRRSRGNSQSPTVSRRASPQSPAHETLREAMSPVAARCHRALFAAVLWHRGVAHEALTAGVYLRYHGGTEKGQKQKHSVMRRSKSALEGASAANAANQVPGNKGGQDRGDEDGLPPSLRHLTRLWETLVSSVERRISDLVPHSADLSPPPPSPLMPPPTRRRRSERRGGRRRGSSSRRRNEPEEGNVSPSDAVTAAQSLVLENALFLMEVEPAFTPSLAPHWPAPDPRPQTSLMSASGCSNDTLTPSSPLADFCAGPFPLQPSQFLTRFSPQADSWFSDEAQMLRISSRHPPGVTSSPSEGDDSARCTLPTATNQYRIPRGQSEVESMTTNHRPLRVQSEMENIVINQHRVQRSQSEAESSTVACRGMASMPGEDGLELPASAALRHLAENQAEDVEELDFCTRTTTCQDLRAAMLAAARQASLRRHGLQALNWLLRSVVSPQAIHDLVWTFVQALQRQPTPPMPSPNTRLSPGSSDGSGEGSAGGNMGGRIVTESQLEHPVSGTLEMANGESCRQVSLALHAFLRSLSDLMPHLPAYSPVLRLAVRAWALPFTAADHAFLHSSQVFSRLSRLLHGECGVETEGRGEEEEKEEVMTGMLEDVTSDAQIRLSSNDMFAKVLTDGSTETFWTSADDEDDPLPCISVTCPSGEYFCLHVDNTRDTEHALRKIKIRSEAEKKSMAVQSVAIPSSFVGWLCFDLTAVPRQATHHFQFVTSHTSVRVRALQAFAFRWHGRDVSSTPHESLLRQLCQEEALGVFRLLTSRILGRFMLTAPTVNSGDTAEVPAPTGAAAIVGEVGGTVGGVGGDTGTDGEVSADNADLQEHMVGILFSGHQLSGLQKQVCAHIVRCLRQETRQTRDRVHFNDDTTMEDDDEEHDFPQSSLRSDTYCFELLSQVLALSGSAVGKSYLCKQSDLIQDLFYLLHVGTPRVQRQILTLLYRVLPELSPEEIDDLLFAFPAPNFQAEGVDASETTDFDPLCHSFFDILLLLIGKAMTFHIKVRGSTTGVHTVSLPRVPAWWWKGRSSPGLALNVARLLRDLLLPDPNHFGPVWRSRCESALLHLFHNLGRLPQPGRRSALCARQPCVFVCAAACCLLQGELCQRIDRACESREKGKPRFCENHDDGQTAAVVVCEECAEALCSDCDRCLHLPRPKRGHRRQVVREQQEVVRVECHEGCSRVRLHGLMMIVDRAKLKAVIECKSALSPPVATPLTSRDEFCERVLPCGHPCRGVPDEAACLPCLTTGCEPCLRQDADDLCMVCFTEALGEAPCVQVPACGHILHLHCMRAQLAARWPGPRITFAFARCPICKGEVKHPALNDLLESIEALEEEVRRKAVMRLQYEGLETAEDIVSPGSRFFQDPEAFAIDRYAYFVCFKCGKPYYGGEARCDVGIRDQFDPTELVCGACSDVTRAQMCPKHSMDYLEYKCRYCCSVAVFFCFGTTHFCQLCHDNINTVMSTPKDMLPHCPAGPACAQLEGDVCPLHVRHPATGEEFALGCGICRNAHTF